MSSYLPAILSWLQLYGYPVLWVSVFIAAVGLPLPTTLLLLVPLAISASTIGDNVGYWLGRRFGSRFLDWLEQQSRSRFLSTSNIPKARAYFTQHGGWAIFLTRFLLSALGSITNILAGADLYPYKRFLLYDICGETIGATTLLLLGFTFGASWEAIGDLLGTFSALLLACILAIVLAILLVRTLRGREQSAYGRDPSLPTEGKRARQRRHTRSERMPLARTLLPSQRRGNDSLPL